MHFSIYNKCLQFFFRFFRKPKMLHRNKIMVWTFAFCCFFLGFVFLFFIHTVFYAIFSHFVFAANVCFCFVRRHVFYIIHNQIRLFVFLVFLLPKYHSFIFFTDIHIHTHTKHKHTHVRFICFLRGQQSRTNRLSVIGQTGGHFTIYFDQILMCLLFCYDARRSCNY